MSTPEEVEPLILSLTREYLKKKPFFSIQDIVAYISNRTRAKPYLNRNKIEKSFQKELLVKVMKMSEKSFMEWDNKEDEIYNEL